MFVEVACTILAPVSFTFTGTVELWITSPFVGVTICTVAGLLGRGLPGPVVGPDDAFVPDEHPDRTTASVSAHGTRARRRDRRRLGPMSRHHPAPGAEPRQSL
jgi:hypothetical protein